MRWLLVLLLVGPAWAELPWQGYSPETLARARAEKKFVLLDLEAVWCHWCHVMDATTYQDPRVVERLEKSFVLVKVDQDSQPDLSLKYEDYGWPATILFGPDGQELARRSGYLRPDEMVALLDQLVAEGKPIPDEDGSTPGETTAGSGTISDETRKSMVERFFEHYDYKLGGWGFTHKFLNADCAEFALLRAREGDAKARKMAKQTLDAQLQLIDPVWGGVYQYSDSGIWTSPHYEKIMSTQTQNLRSFALAYAQLGDPRYAKAVDQIARYMLTFLRSSEGAFYVSQDADVVQGEHSHDYFALNDKGRRARGIPRVDKNLYARENGWAIEALAESYAYTGKPAYLKAAQTAAEWVIAHRSLANGGFAHGPQQGPFLGDTLSMGKGLLALYAVTGERKWLERARSAGSFLARFSTPDGFGVRQREENVEVVRFLVQLADATGDPKFREVAAPAYKLLSNPELALRYNTACVLLADHDYRATPTHIVVTGSKSAPAAARLFLASIRVPDRGKRVEWLDPSEGPLPNADSVYPVGSVPVAFVCARGRCTKVEQPDRIVRALEGK